MALSRKVDDKIKIILSEQRRDGLPVADIGLYEYMAFVALDALEVLQIARIEMCIRDSSTWDCALSNRI